MPEQAVRFSLVTGYPFGDATVPRVAGPGASALIKHWLHHITACLTALAGSAFFTTPYYSFSLNILFKKGEKDDAGP